MESNQLSEQDVRRAVTSFRVTLSYQLEPLRAIPFVLGNPIIALAVTKQVMRELPQDIETVIATMDELREVEQWADEHGIKIRHWEILNDAKAVLETARSYISERPN